LFWRIINARGPDDECLTIEVADATIRSVQEQESLIENSDAVDFLAIEQPADGMTYDAKGLLVLPGFVDMHVHTRVPGLSHKEDLVSFEMSAFHGGVVAACDMPNTSPPLIDRVAIENKIKLFSECGVATKFFIGAAQSNVGQLSQLCRDFSEYVAGIKIYYGHSTGNLMFDDLNALHSSLKTCGDALLVFHSEDQCCIDRNTKKYGDYASKSENRDFAVHSRIRDSEGAIRSTEHILKWAQGIENPVHMAHISTADEIEKIVKAKKTKPQITSEVAPHHLLLSVDDYEALGPFLKVNPPVRQRNEVERLKECLRNGLIDVIATDHAPHTAEEKKQTIGLSPSGLPSVELFGPLAFKIAKMLSIPLNDLVPMISQKPAELSGFSNMGTIDRGKSASFVVIKSDTYWVNNGSVIAKCGWTPYDGYEFYERVAATWKDGRRVYPQKT
jgi:dihydroorotase